MVKTCCVVDFDHPNRQVYLSSSFDNMPSSKKRFKIGIWLTMGGVQVLDFVSDVAVVIQWYVQKDNTLANLAVCFLGVAVLVATLGTVYYLFHENGWGSRSGWPVLARAPLVVLLPLLNLHVLFAGLTMDGDDTNHRSCFYLGKGYETIYESVPMAVITIYYICTVDPELQRSSSGLIMLPSLILSSLSIAYGMTATAMNENDLRGLGPGLTFFFFFILDTLWILSGCWGLFSTGQVIVLYCVLGVLFVFLISLYIKQYPILDRMGWDAYVKCCFYFVSIMPYMFFDASPRLAWVKDPEAHFLSFTPLIARRICLFVMSVFTLVAIQAHAWVWIIMFFAVAVHTFLTVKILYLDDVCAQRLSTLLQKLQDKSCAFYRRKVEVETKAALQAGHLHTLGNVSADAVYAVYAGAGLSDIAAVPDTMPDSSASEIQFTEVANGALEATVSSSKSWQTQSAAKVHKCLQELVLHNAWFNEKVRRFVDVSEGVLRTPTVKACPSSTQVVENLVLAVSKSIQRHYPDLSEAAILNVSYEILLAYEPIEKNNKLLRSRILRVLHIMTESHAVTELPSAMDEEQDHFQYDINHNHATCSGDNELALDLTANPTVKMRALPLVHGANVWLWKSSKGRPEHHDLSASVEHCATFISHSWSDPWWTKATMLRNHLFLRQYDSVVIALSLIGCLQSLPVCFLLQNVADITVSFVLLYIISAWAMFAIVWAHLSGILLPSTWGPWPTELDDANGIWLDKVCIDQTSNTTKQAGIANLGVYLLRCKTMTVMLGETYLTRLWTTFELAMYCKMHRQQLEDRLSFLSLKWANTLSIKWLFFKVQLDETERRQLDKYSCLDSQCYLPADRVFVLAAIRKTWGSEENFDQFVRTELPEILRKGKEEFMWRGFRSMHDVLDLLF